MRLSVGGGDRKLCVLFRACAMQTRDEIAWQKRTVRGGAQHPRNLRPGGRCPVERGKNARERPRKILHRIGNNGQPECREPRRIAIGVENKSVALRLQPRDHARQDGAAADLAPRLFFSPPPPPPPPRGHTPPRAPP